MRRVDLAHHLVNGLAPVEWVWNGWIAKGDLALLAGPSGIGKSMLTLALAVHCVRRRFPFLGEAVGGNGRVVILDYEMSLDEIVSRMRGFGMTPQESESLAYFQPDFQLSDNYAEGELKETLLELRPSLVVIDSFRRAWPAADENSSADVATALALPLHLAREFRCTFIVVHHTPYAGRPRPRGSGDFRAAPDTVILATPQPGGLVLHHDKVRRVRAHAPVALEIISFQGQTSVQPSRVL